MSASLPSTPTPSTPNELQKNIRPFRISSRKGLTIIIKIGTSSICDEVTHFTKLSTLSQLVETIVELKSKGNDVILVTSGAVGTGLRRLNLATKPKVISKIQVNLFFQLYLFFLLHIYNILSFNFI